MESFLLSKHNILTMIAAYSPVLAPDHSTIGGTSNCVDSIRKSAMERYGRGNGNILGLEQWRYYYS